MKRLLLILALAAVLAGCQSAGPGQRWVRSEVHFGLSKPDGSLITAQEWDAFVNEIVTPKFPAGLSIVDSHGQWRNASGRIEREPSKVLVILHPRTAASESEIDDIRARYCRRFQQEAVMKVTTSALVTF